MKKIVPWAALSALTILAAACGGGSIGVPAAPPVPTAGPSSGPSTATVAFKVTVPQAASIVTSGSKRPNFAAPASTTAVSFTVTTVNGTAYTGTPSKFNLTGSNCTTSTSGNTCTLNVTVPAGDDVIQIKTFDANSNTTGQGNVEVQGSNGGTISEPTTLGGTVAKISVSAFGEEGVAGTYPVVVTAYDSTGAAIIGTYSTPITLADSDTNGHTTLSATSVPDSTTGASITLKYDGVALATPVSITASASGIAASNIRNASFPDASYPTVNNATGTIQVDQTFYTAGENTPVTWSTTTGTSTNNYTNTTKTGASLAANGTTVNNLVSQSTQGIVGNLPGTATFDPPLFYAWTPNGTSLSYGYVGYNYSSSVNSATELCAAPYNKLVVLPVPTSAWDALAGSGDCTFTYSYNGSSNTQTETDVFKADGSYHDTGNYTYGSTVGSYNWSVKPDGSAVLVNSVSSGSTILTLPVPSPGASTAPVLIQTFPGAVPSPGSTTTPAPVATTAPNPWPIIASSLQITLTGPPQPLDSDKFTPKGSIAALPSGCVVPTTLLGSQPSLSEVDEQLTVTDPLYDYDYNYTSIAYQHFYLNGVGEVCTYEKFQDWFMYNGSVAWYLGTGTNYYTDASSSYAYLTNATAVSAFKATRDFTQAMPAAAQALASVNVALRQQQLSLHHQQLQMARQSMKRN